MRARLAARLGPDIAAGSLALVSGPAADAGSSPVTLRLDPSGLFPPGKDSVDPRYLPLLTRLGQALDAEHGRIRLIAPASASARLLAQRRADAVAALLSVTAPGHDAPSRLAVVVGAAPGPAGGDSIDLLVPGAGSGGS
jgi:hypothetical protein